MVEISHLNLNQLKELLISACAGLKRVDISDLVNLTTSLRIEDIDTLDYLNIQNGSVANYFSLFYSDHIHYACIDSLAAEYNEVSWRMLSGAPTLTNCTTLPTTAPPSIPLVVSLFPNPTQEKITLSTTLTFDQIRVIDIYGQSVSTVLIQNQQLDFSQTASGIYLLLLEYQGISSYHKIIKY